MRPRTFDEDQVLDQALELFWKRGYQATTTRDLEAELGLSQSSLYNAFGSKQALLHAALDRYEARIDHDLVGPLADAVTGLEAVDAFFVALGHWVTHDGRRGCMVINLMAEDGGATPAIRTRTRRYRHRVRTVLRRSLARACELGQVDADDVDLRADLLMSAVLGLNIAARGGASVAELQRLLAGTRAEIAGWVTVADLPPPTSALRASATSPAQAGEAIDVADSPPPIRRRRPRATSPA